MKSWPRECAASERCVAEGVVDASELQASHRRRSCPAWGAGRGRHVAVGPGPPRLRSWGRAASLLANRPGLQAGRTGRAKLGQGFAHGACSDAGANIASPPASECSSCGYFAASPPGAAWFVSFFFLPPLPPPSLPPPPPGCLSFSATVRSSLSRRPCFRMNAWSFDLRGAEPPVEAAHLHRSGLRQAVPGEEVQPFPIGTLRVTTHRCLHLGDFARQELRAKGLPAVELVDEEQVAQDLAACESAQAHCAPRRPRIAPTARCGS